MAYVFRLYIAGNNSNSINAIENVKKICAEILTEKFEIKVVDISKHPELALEDDIIATPTCVKVEPLPKQRIFGDFADKGMIGLFTEVFKSHLIA